MGRPLAMLPGRTDTCDGNTPPGSKISQLCHKNNPQYKPRKDIPGLFCCAKNVLKTVENAENYGIS